MSMMKFVLAATLRVTSVTVDKQVMQTSDGAQIVWTVSLSTSESYAAFTESY